MFKSSILSRKVKNISKINEQSDFSTWVLALLVPNSNAKYIRKFYVLECRPRVVAALKLCIIDGRSQNLREVVRYLKRGKHFFYLKPRCIHKM